MQRSSCLCGEAYVWNALQENPLPRAPARTWSATCIILRQRCYMDKEHVKGAVDKVVGKTKEVAGHVTGDRKLEAEGKINQAKGAIHNKVGDARDAGKEAIDSVRN